MSAITESEMLIISNRKKLVKLFEPMDTDEILADMIKTRKTWQQDKREYDGSTSAYFWLNLRYKVALVELVRREFE